MKIEKGRAGIVTKEQIEEDIEGLKAAGGQPPFVLVKHPALYIIGAEDLAVRVMDNDLLSTSEYVIVNPDHYQGSDKDGNWVSLSDIIDDIDL